MKQIKIVALILIFLIVLVSALFNTGGQYYSIKEAKKRNTELENKVWALKEANKKMILQIEHASSSAYLNQQARDKFGLGTTNDVWLIVSEENQTNLFPEVMIGDNKPNYLRWLEMFTN